MLEPNQQPLRLDSKLEELTLHSVQVDLDCLGADVLRVFEKNSSLPGIILTENNQFFGMVSRRHFFEHMSRPYSLELFSKRPIRVLYQFAASKPLVFPSTTLIMTAAQKALQRSQELLYEPIVVQTQQKGAQVLDAHQLLLAQSKIHQLVMEALQESQQELFQEKELAQVTLQSIGDAVITTDALGRIESLNPVAEKLLGWALQEVKGLRLTEVFKIFDEITQEVTPNPVEIVLREGKIIELNSHTILITRDGQEIAIDDSAAPIRSKDGSIIGAVLVFRNVTESRSMARQLSWQAAHDALTGLVNRREFGRRLERALVGVKSQNQQHTLCYMDLDQFKVVNDTCGHLAGDELLRQVTSLLQAEVRKTDTLARLGGDEFGLLLHQCSVDQGMRVAQVLRRKIQEFRFFWEGKTFAIGVSIGVVGLHEATYNPDEILSAADAACYAAKNKGRNQVNLYKPQDSELVKQHGEMQWVVRIKKALEQNLFQLYHQPIIPLHPNHAAQEHYEILLRMLDETGKIFLPMSFIPAAERYNLMTAIDRWVIRHLFKSQQARFQDCLERCRSSEGNFSACIYAINLSSASLNDEQFIEFLQEEFALHQIPPQTICFEVTEMVAIANLTKTSEFMHRLKKLGCRFALDDFGSGMSSFKYLKTLPVDYLKIDGGFIKNMLEDVVAGAIVEAIHRIGQVVGIQTIAEFVEDEVTLEKLRLIGVDYAQGFGLAEPSPLSQILT